jgi:hypothetical protein
MHFAETFLYLKEGSGLIIMHIKLKKLEYVRFVMNKNPAVSLVLVKGGHIRIA